MPKIDPDVEKMFSRHLRTWNDALQHWEKKCKPVRDEYKKNQSRRALVADRTWPSSSFDPDRTLTDAPNPVFPGETQAQEAKEKEVERRADNCNKTIDLIKKTIERLNHARA